VRRTGILAAIASLTLVVGIQEGKPQPPVTENVTFKFNERKPTLSSDGLNLVSFGYPRILSNLLWLRFLQHTPTEKVPPGELSWIYFDLDTITTIDPEFLPAFEHGGVFLSVVTEDKRGAEHLLSKGTRLHPDRWRLHAYLAYHYQFELDEPENAAPHYLAGSRLPGAPTLLALLAARGLSRQESVDSSIRFLEEMREGATDEHTRKRLDAKIAEWRRKKREEGRKAP
jgi:hypothetical protein